MEWNCFFSSWYSGTQMDCERFVKDGWWSGCWEGREMMGEEKTEKGRLSGK